MGGLGLGVVEVVLTRREDLHRLNPGNPFSDPAAAICVSDNKAGACGGLRFPQFPRARVMLKLRSAQGTASPFSA